MLNQYGLFNQRWASGELTTLGVAEVKPLLERLLSKAEVFDAVFCKPYVRSSANGFKIFLADTWSYLLIISKFVNELRLMEKNGSFRLGWMNNHTSPFLLCYSISLFAHQVFVWFFVEWPLPMNFAMTTATLASVEGEFFLLVLCLVSFVVYFRHHIAVRLEFIILVKTYIIWENDICF